MTSHGKIRRIAFGWLAMAMFCGGAGAQTQPGSPPAPPLDPVQAIDAAIHAIDTGDLQTADRLIREVNAINPKMSRLQLASGLYAKELRRFPEAIEALGIYNETDEGRRDYRGWAALGSVFLDSYMYSSAIGALEKALELAPLDEKEGTTRAKIALDLARTRIGLNNPKDAKESIRDAQSSASQDAEIQSDVCELASRVGDEDTARAAGGAAIRAYRSELSVNPLSISAHRGLARCYEVLLQLQSRKLAGNPNDGEAFIEGARLLSDLAEIERRTRLLDARGLVLQALESNASSVEWRLLAATYEIELGAMGEAQAHIDDVLKTDPNNANALALRNRLAPANR
ncbi:MAG TPA: hypothetical protein P5081_18670 [Phycisphaerae bacterium]|nr:hypothetical protein [Phycisphaerae bacterium]HRW54897.1 hypothetical protein [Phycisphaerae bacterium]